MTTETVTLEQVRLRQSEVTGHLDALAKAVDYAIARGWRDYELDGTPRDYLVELRTALERREDKLLNPEPDLGVAKADLKLVLAGVHTFRPTSPGAQADLSEALRRLRRAAGLDA